MVTTGGPCLILCRMNALLAVDTRLWRWVEMSENDACVRVSADAKHAGKERLRCMLMAPGPSGWVAGATESRLPEGAEQVVGPKVDPRAVVASKEALMAARLQARKPNAMGSSTNTRDYQSTIWIDGLACISGALTWCPHCGARLTHRPQSA